MAPFPDCLGRERYCFKYNDSMKNSSEPLQVIWGMACVVERRASSRVVKLGDTRISSAACALSYHELQIRICKWILILGHELQIQKSIGNQPRVLEYKNDLEHPLYPLTSPLACEKEIRKILGLLTIVQRHDPRDPIPYPRLVL